MGENLETLREKLSKGGDRASAEAQKRAVKSAKLTFYGTKKPVFNKLLAEFVELNQSVISLTPLNQLLSNLWKSNVFEERLFALQVLSAFRGLLGEREWVLLNEWDETVDNFALSDAAGHIRALLLRRYPERVTTLVSWCASENPWKRRAAVVALLIIEPAEKGHAQIVIPARQAIRVIEALLAEKDPIVQKTVVWVGRSIAHATPENFMKLLETKKARLHKGLLRAAADGLPERQREEFLAALERPEPPPPPPPARKTSAKGAAKAAKALAGKPIAPKPAAAALPASPAKPAKPAKPVAVPAPVAKKPAAKARPAQSARAAGGAKPRRASARTAPNRRRAASKRPKPKSAARARPAARSRPPAARKRSTTARRAPARGRASSSKSRGRRRA